MMVLVIGMVMVAMMMILEIAMVTVGIVRYGGGDKSEKNQNDGDICGDFGYGGDDMMEVVVSRADMVLGKWMRNVAM